MEELKQTMKQWIIDQKNKYGHTEMMSGETCIGLDFYTDADADECIVAILIDFERKKISLSGLANDVEPELVTDYKVNIVPKGRTLAGFILNDLFNSLMETTGFTTFSVLDTMEKPLVALDKTPVLFNSVLCQIVTTEDESAKEQLRKQYIEETQVDKAQLLKCEATGLSYVNNRLSAYYPNDEEQQARGRALAAKHGYYGLLMIDPDDDTPGNWRNRPLNINVGFVDKCL